MTMPGQAVEPTGVAGSSGVISRIVAAWRNLPTRVRLILIVLLIDLVAAIVSCALIALIARRAVEVETQAARSTVEPLVADTIRLASDQGASAVLYTLDLRIQALRHVRVAVFDPQGRRTGYTVPSSVQDQPEAPAWFAWLISPEPLMDDFPILVQGVKIGTAVVTTEPRDEINEIWNYAKSLAFSSLLLNLAVLTALYVAVGRVMKPLERLAEALTQLERKDYTARLPPPNSRELAIISERFNSFAGTLGETRAANARLNRQLLTAQDDERRRIALELHDEFGPCMFALEANASSIARIADGPTEPDRSKLTSRANDISTIVSQVQARNRELLNALRPHGLGQVPLTDCLNLLIRDFAHRHPSTRFEGEFGKLARGYGDVVDLTVFRCVQESMTNAVRHGAAKRVRAQVREEHRPRAPSRREHRLLCILVRDDGTGFTPGHGIGLGLSGMRERVEALEGRFETEDGHPGVTVRLAIPIDSQQDADIAIDERDTLPPPDSLSPSPHA